MKHFYFFTFLLLLTCKSIGQISEIKAQEFVRVKKIDTCLIYSYDCNYGEALLEIPDSCASNTHYLIWKKGKSYFLKQFKRCGDFEAESIDTLNPLSFYISNRRLIDKQEIKQPTAYEIKRRGNKSDTLAMIALASHVCYYKFELRVKKDIKEKFISTYDLNFKKFDNGQSNIYYDSNQRSQLKTMIDKMAPLIKKIS